MIGNAQDRRELLVSEEHAGPLMLKVTSLQQIGKKLASLGNFLGGLLIFLGGLLGLFVYFLYLEDGVTYYVP